jgi:two-component system, NtrC family, sensor kinase
VNIVLLTSMRSLMKVSISHTYHGACLEKQGINISLQHGLDPAGGMADVYPQEITRVLLNLISNGYYAATKRASGIALPRGPSTSTVRERLSVRR